MQLTKMKKIMLPITVAATLSSANVFSATANYSVGFTTVPDITITQVQALNFGTYLGLGATASCELLVGTTGATFPGHVAMKLGSSSAATAGADINKLTNCGTVPAAARGQYGLYEVQGIAGGTVSVTVNNITAGTDFNYVASGCVGKYDAAGNGDTCEVVTGGTPTTGIILASSDDTIGNGAGSGTPTPGVTRIAIGGVITATQAHTANQVLTESFSITVTY